MNARFFIALHHRAASSVLIPLAIFAAADPVSAQDCSVPTEGCTRNLSLDPPRVQFGPGGGSVPEQQPTITVYFDDDRRLAQGSFGVQISGGTIVNQQFVWDDPLHHRAARMVLQVSLGSSSAVLSAWADDDLGQTTTASATYQYSPPPPPPQRADPLLGVVREGRNQNLALCDGCSDAVLTYSTPAYVSRDEPRAVTLFYSTGQADPHGYVQIDARDRSLDPAHKMILQLRDAGGALVTFANNQQSVEFTTGAGDNRLGAHFNAGHLGTGVHAFTAEVTSWWPNEQRTATVPVYVPVIDERTSPFGAGWSVAGLQRLRFQGSNLVLTTGDGGIALLTYQSCTGGTCHYAEPAGDFTTFIRKSNGEYRRTWPDGTYAEFDGAGRQLRVVDRYGNATAYGYVNGLLSTITDPAGLVTTLAYQSGSLSTITDPTARVSRFTVSGGRLTQVKDPTNTLALVPTYDTRNRLTQWVDVRGGQWNVAYDAANRLDSITAPSISTSSVDRPATQVRSIELASAAGTSRVLPDSAYLRVVAPRGAVTRTWVDRFGQAIRVHSPDGRVSTAETNANGLPEFTQDFDGNARWFVYDLGDHRLTEVTERSGSGLVRTEIDYAPFSQPAAVRVNGAEVRYTYHSDGRPQASIFGTDTTAYVYDLQGRLRSVTDAEGNQTQVDYQTSGWQNTSKVTSADGTFVQYGYDVAGRTLTVTAQDGSVSTTAYDSLNRVRSTTDALNRVTQYTYSGNKPDPTSIVDARNQVYAFRYNLLGWVEREVHPRGDSTMYAFDREGNVTSRSGRGFTVTATYDALGRALTRTTGTMTTTFAYDPGRTWMSASNAVSTDTIRFLSDGRFAESATRRGSLRFGVAHQYADQRLTGVSVTGPWEDRSMAYGYDDYTMRLNGIRDLMTASEVAAWNSTLTDRTTWMVVNGVGQLSRVRFPGPGQIDLGYTDRNQLESYSVAGQSAVGPLGRFYEYDTRGRIGTAWSETRSRVLGYDVTGRLTGINQFDRQQEWVCTDPWDPMSCTRQPVDVWMGGESFAWDQVGNPTDRGAVTQTGNRLTSYDGWTLAYDLAGNLVSRSKSGMPSQTFYWNGLGQLDSVSTAGVGKVRFGYDGFGRRVRRTAPNGAVTQYLYRGHDLLLEMDGSGNLRREYTYYPGIDRPHSVREHASGVAGRYYFTMELPGHVSGLLNASGQMVNEYRYSPFGKPVLVQEGVPNPLRYMAREWVADAGLYYVRNRWYDPEVGRFISEDPIGLAGGINVYAYAWNDPISHRDPLGLTPDECQIILKLIGASADFIRRACSAFRLDPMTVVAERGENPFAWFDEWFDNAQQEVLPILGRGLEFAAQHAIPGIPVAEMYDQLVSFWDDDRVCSSWYPVVSGLNGVLPGAVVGGIVEGAHHAGGVRRGAVQGEVLMGTSRLTSAVEGVRRFGKSAGTGMLAGYAYGIWRGNANLVRACYFD